MPCRPSEHRSRTSPGCRGPSLKLVTLHARLVADGSGNDVALGAGARLLAAQDASLVLLIDERVVVGDLLQLPVARGSPRLSPTLPKMAMSPTRVQATSVVPIIPDMSFMLSSWTRLFAELKATRSFGGWQVGDAVDITRVVGFEERFDGQATGYIALFGAPHPVGDREQVALVGCQVVIRRGLKTQRVFVASA